MAKALETPKRWTEAEIRQLRELSKKYSNKEISQILGRTKESIQNKRHLLGIKSEKPRKSFARPFKQKMWTDAEIGQLRELSKAYSNKEIARLLGRTEDSVRGQRDVLGIKLGNPKDKKWTEQEITQLKHLVSEKKSNQEIAKIMDRSRSAIQQKRAKIGLGDYSVRKWTEQEEAELRELALEMTTAELAEHFNREWTAVERKCKSLGIVTQSEHLVVLGPYTAEEDAYLIQHARYMMDLQLAEKLGKTVGSIKSHKTRLRKKGIDVPYYLNQNKKGSSERF